MSRVCSSAGPRVAAVFVAVIGAASCSFPDHTFIDDDLFYAEAGGASAAGGTAGTTSAGGSSPSDGGRPGGGSSVGGSSTGGTAGGAASGGAGGLGGGGDPTAGGAGGQLIGPDGGAGAGGSPLPDGALPDGPSGSGGAPNPPDGGTGGVEAGPSCGTRDCVRGEVCISNTCVPLVEDCGNVTDDDEDDLVDCADPDCGAGYVCASTPAGWTGPVALWSGVSGAAPSCSAAGGYPTSFFTAHTGLVVPPYTCPSCNCAPAPSTYCDDLKFYFDVTTDCSGTVAWTHTAPVDGSCRVARNGNSTGQTYPSSRSSELNASPASFAHGTCLPNQTQPDFPEASWAGEVRGCGSPAVTGGGCGPAQCVPRPSAPFGTELCVFRSGDASCPADYPVRRPGPGEEYHQTIVEGRSCSPCACGSPTCGGTVSLYTDENCGASGGSSITVGIGPGPTCTQTPADPSRGSDAQGPIDTRSLRWTNPGPVCGSMPSLLVGAPRAESAVTVCCQAE